MSARLCSPFSSLWGLCQAQRGQQAPSGLEVGDSQLATLFLTKGLEAGGPHS